jgi:hypothetical protein
MLQRNLLAKTTAEHGTAGSEEQQTLLSKRKFIKSKLSPALKIGCHI